MDETAARRLQAAQEILDADQTQSEAQLRRSLGLPPRGSAAAIPIPDEPKFGRILTHDDVRAIVREEVKPLMHSQAEALGAIDSLASDIPALVDSIAARVVERMAAANTFHIGSPPIKPGSILFGLRHARFDRTT
ncbi:hypothetical protein GS452_08485 [Rhodococcus hoagii]|nr:hypothetical protein [Prescottella equi]